MKMITALGFREFLMQCKQKSSIAHVHPWWTQYYQTQSFTCPDTPCNNWKIFWFNNWGVSGVCVEQWEDSWYQRTRLPLHHHHHRFYTFTSKYLIPHNIEKYLVQFTIWVAWWWMRTIEYSEPTVLMFICV